MRILFVAPRTNFPGDTPGWLGIPLMSLLVLEALCGDGHQVVTAEEEWGPIPLREKWDLVGITAITATAPRAYELARIFRERGAQVILGGIHPSVLPEEASRHADAVLVGEAEAVWPRILEDAAHHRLKRIYHNHKPEKLQLPLVAYKHRQKSQAPTISPVIASRGCPNACEFCSVPRIYGTRPRKVPVAQIIEQVKRSRSKYIAFLDDNLAASREHALELFAALRDLQVKIIAQVPVKFMLDQVLFQTAVAAGLKGVFVGFETIEEKSLERFRKSVTVEAAAQAIRECRAAGVLIHGSFIFGMDEHDKTIFGRTLDFVMEHKITSVSANVLTPYPGTPLYDRMLAEGRLLHRNWGFYDHLLPVFQPARMTVTDLAEGIIKFRASLYGLKGIAHRLPPWFPADPYAYFHAYLHINAAYRRTTRGLRNHFQNYFHWLRSRPTDPFGER